MQKRLYKSPWVAIPGVLILLGLGFSVQRLFGTAESNTSNIKLQSTISEQESVPESEALLSTKPVEEVNLKEMNTEQVKQLVTGFWSSKYYGIRHLVIREDGTATIYYQPNMLAQFLMGGQLTIHYEWEYDREKTQVVFKATEGYPQKSYEYVLNKWGANQRQTVLEATDQNLLLLDGDEKTEHDWRRIEAIPEKIIKIFQITED